MPEVDVRVIIHAELFNYGITHYKTTRMYVHETRMIRYVPVSEEKQKREITLSFGSKAGNEAHIRTFISCKMSAGANKSLSWKFQDPVRFVA